MTDDTRVVVCDAGPLIHLDELDCLELLDDSGSLLVPAVVWSEVSLHRPGVLAQSRVSLQRVEVDGPPDERLRSLAESLSLHAGEREALQIACQRHPAMLLSDDTAARAAGEMLRLTVHGTIGIVFRAIRQRRLSGAQVAEILRSIPTRSTLHIRRSLLDEFITRAVEAGERHD